MGVWGRTKRLKALETDSCAGVCPPRSYWDASLAGRKTCLILLACGEKKNGVQWLGLSEKDVSQIQQEMKIRNKS